MDVVTVKQAVSKAKAYVEELFAEEKPTDIALEEVEFDHAASEWLVTVGFSREWDMPRSAIAVVAGLKDPRRSFKVVRISEESGEVVSVKNYETVH